MTQIFNFKVRCYDSQNALSLALASDLSYRNESAIKDQVTKWGFGEFRFFENKKSEKQAFIAADGKALLVSFRGTDQTEIKDWLADLNFFLEPGPWGKVHGGFQYALSSIWPEMNAFLKPLLDSSRKLMITGHSLGGAMAVLAAADLIKAGQPVHNLYTFGQPKVGDTAFASEIDKKIKFCYCRFVNHNDIVPRILPSMIGGYCHAGQKFYFDSKGKLNPYSFWQLEFLDQWLYKWAPKKILEEDIGDHMMPAYIKNLEMIQQNRMG